MFEKKQTLHLTEDQVHLLVDLAEGVLEAIEDTSSSDEVDIRSVVGIPKQEEQLGQLGRIWFKLRRLLNVLRPGSVSGSEESFS